MANVPSMTATNWTRTRKPIDWCDRCIRLVLATDSPEDGPTIACKQVGEGKTCETCYNDNALNGGCEVVSVLDPDRSGDIVTLTLQQYSYHHDEALESLIWNYNRAARGEQSHDGIGTTCHFLDVRRAVVRVLEGEPTYSHKERETLWDDLALHSAADVTSARAATAAPSYHSLGPSAHH